MIELEQALPLKPRETPSCSSDVAAILGAIAHADGLDAAVMHNLDPHILGLGMDIQQDPLRMKCPVDFAKDVDHALQWQSSQRVGKYGDIEAVSGIVEGGGVSKMEVDSVS